MLKTATILMCAAMLASLAGAQQANDPPTLPPSHPPIVPAKDEPPAADPQDVNSIDAILNAYYDVISGPAGEERNWDRFRSLFLPDARFITTRTVRDRSVPVMMKPADFMDFNKKYFERGGYFEREINRRVDSFGSIAQIFSTYESRRRLDDPKPYSRGINSIQLLNAGHRWWIVTVMWDHERPDRLPIPPQYLSHQMTGER